MNLLLYAMQSYAFSTYISSSSSVCITFLFSFLRSFLNILFANFRIHTILKHRYKCSFSFPINSSLINWILNKITHIVFFFDFPNELNVMDLPIWWMRSNRFDVRWLFAQVLSSLFSNRTSNLRESNKTFIQLLFLLTLETYITNCRFEEVKMCLAFEFRWKIQYKFWDEKNLFSFLSVFWCEFSIKSSSFCIIITTNHLYLHGIVIEKDYRSPSISM